MIDIVVSILRSVLVSIGALAAGDPSTMGAAAVVLAAVALLAMALSTVCLSIGSRSPRPRPHTSADDGVVVPAQSDPDAPGRSRPRAPGLAAPAA